MAELTNHSALVEEPVTAPFATAEVQLRPRNSGLIYVWLTLGLVVLAVVGIAGVYALSSHFVGDRFRSLEPFSTTKYLTSYKGLSGSKYRATIRVENDLEWNEQSGRLMLFSTTDDPRPFAALVPTSVSTGIYFTKGQVYTAELEVKEGGLIYVNACQKD